MTSALSCIDLGPKLPNRLRLILILTLAVPMAVAALPQQDPSLALTKPAEEVLEIPAQSRIFLALNNSIALWSAKAGDPVYCVVHAPLAVQGRIAIPAGSFAEGEIAEVRRSGRFRQSVEVHLRFLRIILPNGYSIELSAVPRALAPLNHP